MTGWDRRSAVPFNEGQIPPFSRPCVLALSRGPGFVLVVDVRLAGPEPSLGVRKWRWAHDANRGEGAWIPTGRGFEVRANQAREFAEAVADAADSLAAPPARPR